jgi:ribA/ribD-fused uncharacterized protein
MPEMPWSRVPVDPVIRFYETDRPYGLFSNFSRHPITIDGRLWPTSEHFFQAEKFEDREQQELVRAAKSPFLAAQMGRDRARPMRRDWEQVRDDVMRNVLDAKMMQHDDVRGVLLSTCGASIVEHTANDSYWGDGGDGAGCNRLGIFLMELRDRLVPPKHPQFLVPPWLRYPAVERGDMFYRMGQGESDLDEWLNWRKAQPTLALAHYANYYPAPATWRDF